mgnify:CR=1 FL=1
MTLKKVFVLFLCVAAFSAIGCGGGGGGGGGGTTPTTWDFSGNLSLPDAASAGLSPSIRPAVTLGNLRVQAETTAGVPIKAVTVFSTGAYTLVLDAYPGAALVLRVLNSAGATIAGTKLTYLGTGDVLKPTTITATSTAFWLAMVNNTNLTENDLTGYQGQAAVQALITAFTNWLTTPAGTSFETWATANNATIVAAAAAVQANEKNIRAAYTALSTALTDATTTPAAKVTTLMSYIDTDFKYSDTAGTRAELESVCTARFDAYTLTTYSFSISSVTYNAANSTIEVVTNLSVTGTNKNFFQRH